MHAYRKLSVQRASCLSLPADERRPLAIEGDFDGIRRPEPHAASPSDPERYREIFCGGTD
jgi:hypothetical protein